MVTEPPGDAGGELSALVLARQALRSLVEREPERHPLVVGLVSPIGTPVETVEALLRDSFARFGYVVHSIHLSQLLDDAPSRPWGELPARGERDYYERRMDAGDELRRLVGDGSALAGLAVARINYLRSKTGSESVFILRSLKHPSEESLLRQVYGDAFTLLAISSSADERRETLAHSLSLLEHPSAEAERLIERDERDNDQAEFGQNVREVFSRADAYLPVARGFDSRENVDRMVDLIFGAPFLTPRPEEEAMKLAADASLRSAAMGRQVGAALIPAIGTPVVVGTNEVPKPGGGQFWTDDVPDYRDFQTGEDPNPLYTRRVLEEVLERLNASGWLVENLRGLAGAELFSRAALSPDGSPSVLEGARAASLIEFTRCLHAEQAAIINAARAGVSTAGAVLFTTTFPCHECAKVIVGAGIVEVFYIEPYPKSLVSRLYRDVIDTAPAATGERGLVAGRIPFRPFLGVAPRRYDLAFTAGLRRTGDSPLSFERSAACPRTNGWSEASVSTREAIATGAIRRILAALAVSDHDSVSGTSEQLITPEADREGVEQGSTDALGSGA